VAGPQKNRGGRQKQREASRLGRRSGPSIVNWQKPREVDAEAMRSDAWIDVGWGRLIFGHTYTSNEKLVEDLLAEGQGQRDIAIYLRDPHVVLSLAPHRLFLDPSHTYRLWRDRYRPADKPPPPGVHIRRIKSRAEAEAVNRIYEARRMVMAPPERMLDQAASRLWAYFIAEADIPVEHPAGGEGGERRVVGTVLGIDHVEAFNDPERGASFWCLAVDPQAEMPGLGQALVRHVIEYHFGRERQYVDLSVMHDNNSAIGLYEHLGFERVPAFCVKHKNPINEAYYVPPAPDEHLNPYARIIVDEARRRQVRVEVVDAEQGYFRLKLGTRAVLCRESLTELTSAVAMSRCDDKRVTRRVLEQAGLKVPAQQVAVSDDEDQAFLTKYERIVVKPARGEQGNGISVDIRDSESMREAIALASRFADRVLLEQFVEGEDLRTIVIDGELVAAAVRRPATLTGTGRHTVRQLFEKYNRRRMAATGGESRIPDDSHTLACLRDAGFGWDDTPKADERVRVRKTANLHTGGTIHDVTDRLHPTLAKASVHAAEAIGIPVAGMDLLVGDVEGEGYVIIEANERPGLANHEPAPTASKFLDFLFPQTKRDAR